jgi:hypothetical protein
MIKLQLFLSFVLLFLLLSCASTDLIDTSTDIIDNNIFDFNQIAEVINEQDEYNIEELAEEPIDPVQLLADIADRSQQLDEIEQRLIDMEQLLADMERLLIDMEQFITTEQPDPEETPLPSDITQTLEQEMAQLPEVQPAPQVVPPPPVVPPVQPPPPVIQPPPPVVQPTPPAVQPPPVVVSPPPPVVQPQPPVDTNAANEQAVAGDDSEQQNLQADRPRDFHMDFSPGPASRIEPLIPQDSEIIFSRIVRATVGQIVEIPFRGSGWVYLGELASRRGIVYSSRRNDPEGMSFIFTLEEAGTYVLKFFRQDFIRDFIINDHVQIIVGEAPAASTGWFNPPVDRGRVVAQPRWPSAHEEAQIRSGVRPNAEPVISGDLPATETVSAQRETAAAQGITPIQDSASVQPQDRITETITGLQNIEEIIPPTPRQPPEVIIQRAQSAFDSGNVASAIALLDQFMIDYPGGSDEVFWMYGQFYEANSPNRNILLSLDYYRRLVNEYPQSRRFEEARRRIAYIERFFINIR